MASLQITITDAGRAEVINAANNGTAPITITQVGVGTGQYSPDPAATALQAELKRLDTISGTVVADDTISVTITDESNDAYTVNEFGLYTDNGTLFAVYSHATDSVVQKSTSGNLLMTVDVVLSTLDATNLTFGDTSFSNPPASETVKGVIELADEAEALAGIDNLRAMTPAKVFQAFQQFGWFDADAVDWPNPQLDDITGVRPGLYFAGIEQVDKPSSAYGLVFFYKYDETYWQVYLSGYVENPSTYLFHRKYYAVTGTWTEWLAEINSKNLENFFSGSSNSLNTNGYQFLPGGLIFQWGEKNITTTGTQVGGGYEGSDDVSWPITFPNKCLHAQASPVDVGGTVAEENAWLSGALNNGGARGYVSSRFANTTMTIRYFSIGR